MKRILYFTTPQRLASVLCALAALCLLAQTNVVMGYHFFYKQSGGSQLAGHWKTLPVKFVVDNTPTSFLTDAQTATGTWNNVATAKDVFGALSQSSADFNKANLHTAWGNMPAGGDGQYEIVLDSDGTAMAELGVDPAMYNGYGPSRTELIGGEAVIVDAFLVVNGKRSDFDRLSTMTHELGHIQGLAHSSVGMHNSGTSASGALDPVNVNSVPTMHPFSVAGTARRTLEPDDTAALSELYPEASFATSTGSIEGVVKRCGNDNGVSGANVRAVNTSNPAVQLSRFTGFDGGSDGRFVIRGLPPGSYKLIVEPMGANDFNIAARFGGPPNKQEMDFETEYYNPPQEDDCTEEIPDTPTSLAVGAGSALTGKNIRVNGARLAFVVDDTGSMSNEIGAVRTVLAGFVSTLEKLHSTLGTPFPTTTIVTFKDDVTKRVVSDDAARLQQVIGALTASGGGDCPEAANAALLAAGRQLRNGGVVMLITDANSRPDGPTREAVAQLYRSKSLKSFTLLSGSCEGGIPAFDLPGATPAPAEPSCEGFCAGGSSNGDEYPLPATLGNENAVRTYAEIATETGGIFTAIPGIKNGIPAEVQRYINTGTNIAVSSAVPAVGLVSPGDGPQGAALPVEIRGSNTNFQSSSAVAFSGSGITVNSLAVNSPESITANITIQPGAATGFRDVTVTTGLGSGSVETAVGVGAFNVVAPPASPTVLGVAPSQGARGQTLNLTVSAANTHFATGSSATFGSGVTVNSVSVVNATTLLANVTVAPDTPIGYRDVRVTTGTEVATENVVGPFLVSAPLPAIPRLVSVTPPQGARGISAEITVTGENVNFVNGVSVASFSGAGITVNSTQVLSPTTAKISFTVAPGTELGFRDVFVTTGSEVAAILRAFQVVVFSSVQLQAAGLSVSEGAGAINFTLTRAGNTSGEATVEFATGDGSAKETSDYTTALGSIRFAPGEATKTVTVLITDDAFAEGDETFVVTLANASGAEMGAPASLTLTITDNDTSTSATNPLNDAAFFVREHYHDFLNREPDDAGLQFWTQGITSCGADAQCVQVKRVHVSSAFFLSIEFQRTGYLVYRVHKATFSDGLAHPRGLPRYREFLRDTQLVGRGVVVGQGAWEQQLQQNTQAFARQWVSGAEFTALFPAGMTAAAFVDKLFANSQVTPSQAERDAAIAAFGSGDVAGRAAALLSAVGSGSVINRQYNPAFVLAQYFGYLRRNPDDAPDVNFNGFDFWLNKLNSVTLPGEDVRDDRVAFARVEKAEMVRAFIEAIEYRKRFGQ